MAEMQRVEITPAVRQFAFSILVPADFRQLPMPAEDLDFSNPTVMMPLGVFMAGYGAVLCSVAVRPMSTGPNGEGIGQGSVMEWVQHLSSQQAGSTVKKRMPAARWGTTVVECEAVQASDAGEMMVRAVFFEDGGNLFNVALMAPVAIWGSVEGMLAEMARSFVLGKVQGATRAVVVGGGVPGPAVFGAE